MRKFILIPISLVIYFQSFAGWWPFPGPDPTDNLMKLKELALLAKQLKELEEHSRKFTSQINGIVNVKNSIDKKMDESKRLMSGDYKFAVRHYVPELNRWDRRFQSWDSLIHKKRGHFALNNAQDNDRTDETSPKNYESLSATTLATDEVATQTYDDVDREIEVLEKLRQDMSQATNQKAITELVARINIQKAIIQAKSNRLNAVQVKMSTETSKQMLKEEKWAEDFLR